LDAGATAGMDGSGAQTCTRGAIGDMVNDTVPWIATWTSHGTGRGVGRLKDRAPAADCTGVIRDDRGNRAAEGGAMRELVRHRWVPAAVLALVVAAVLSVAASRSLAAASGTAASGTAAGARPATARPAGAKPVAERREHFIFRQIALTLPFDPALGTTFVWQGDVLNPAAAKVGEAGASCGVKLAA
jgi:hypothetical protein